MNNLIFELITKKNLSKEIYRNDRQQKNSHE